jgi:hypothetical protein
MMKKNTCGILIMGFENRQFFRIKYPVKFRPEIIVDGRTYTVVDVSEFGLKLDYTGATRLPKDGADFVATVGFRTGTRVTVKGSIVRTENPFVMIRLEKGIPREALKAEADLLLKIMGEVPTDRY